MARSMPWSNAVNKKKCPSYKTEKNRCLMNNNNNKKTVKKAKVYRHCSYISGLLVTKWTFFLWKTRKYIFLLLLFILEKKIDLLLTILSNAPLSACSRWIYPRADLVGRRALMKALSILFRTLGIKLFSDFTRPIKLRQHNPVISLLLTYKAAKSSWKSCCKCSNRYQQLNFVYYLYDDIWRKSAVLKLTCGYSC